VSLRVINYINWRTKAAPFTGELLAPGLIKIYANDIIKTPFHPVQTTLLERPDNIPGGFDHVPY
jgi:hypothetical protein